MERIDTGVPSRNRGAARKWAWRVENIESPQARQRGKRTGLLN
jgi:hypothetical protein